MRMKLVVTVTPDMLAWAYNQVKRPTKSSVIEYLRDQIVMYGTDDEFLFGVEYDLDSDEHRAALKWVDARIW